MQRKEKEKKKNNREGIGTKESKEGEARGWIKVRYVETCMSPHVCTYMCVLRV